MLSASLRNLVALAGLLAIGLALPSPSVTLAQVQPVPGALPAEAVRQIESLMAEKAQRTPAQRKVSSDLLREQRFRRGQAIAAEASMRRSLDVEVDGTVLVDIRADVTPEVLARIGDLAGSVVNAVPAYRAIRARVPLERIDTLAPAAKLRHRNSCRTAPRILAENTHQSAGIFERQLEKHGVHNGEHRGVRADAQRDSQYRRAGRKRILPHETQAIPRVSHEHRCVLARI